MQLFQAKARNCLLRAKEKKIKEKQKTTPVRDYETQNQLANALRMIWYVKLCVRYTNEEPEIDPFDFDSDKDF